VYIVIAWAAVGRRALNSLFAPRECCLGDSGDTRWPHQELVAAADRGHGKPKRAEKKKPGLVRAVRGIHGKG